MQHFYKYFASKFSNITRKNIRIIKKELNTLEKLITNTKIPSDDKHNKSFKQRLIRKCSDVKLFSNFENEIKNTIVKSFKETPNNND